jgi:ATP-dependent Zn protease
MIKPLIQIDNEIREMTDEEYANYQAIISEIKPALESEVES